MFLHAILYKFQMVHKIIITPVEDSIFFTFVMSNLPITSGRKKKRKRSNQAAYKTHEIIFEIFG